MLVPLDGALENPFIFILLNKQWTRTALHRILQENNRNVVVVVVEENNRNVVVVVVVVVEENNRFYGLKTYINAQHSTSFSVYILLLRS